MPKRTSENSQAQLHAQIENTQKAIASRFGQQLEETKNRKWNYDKGGPSNGGSRPYNPNEATQRLNDFLTGVGEWRASDTFNPTLTALKTNDTNVPSGHLKAQFDIVTGEFKIDEYNPEGKIIGRLRLDKAAHRVREYDTITFSSPSQDSYVSRRGWEDISFIDYDGMR